MAPIPILFVSKNLKPFEELDEARYASQEDLAPTILTLLGQPVPEEFMGTDLLTPVDHPYALGYFGGKAFYYSDDLSFSANMDEEKPDTPEKDAIANYLMYYYVKRHIKYLPQK